MQQRSHISLYELQRSVKLSVEERFPIPVWVSAEISEMKVNYSGHCYMELVEKGENDGVPKAQARATIWRTAYSRLAAEFLARTNQQLASGVKILARAMVSFHEIYGFSLNIIDIDPSYTLGEVERQRQLTIAQLKQDGVWDMNRQLAMPPVVQRVAVVSSANAAGYQDFCNELSLYAYRVSIRLFDAQMQGALAEESIVAALERIAELSEELDAVVIIRGGGSASDLNCFNGYRLSSHVAQFPLPVITGIGHDKDVSVCDMVAHTSLKTPTAVAAWIVDKMAQAEAALDRAALQLRDSALAATRHHQILLERVMAEVLRSANESLTRSATQLTAIEERLPLVAEAFISRQKARIDSATALVESNSPRRIMQLGFSVVRSEGHAVTSAESLADGARLDIEMADGVITATVDKNRR